MPIRVTMEIIPKGDESKKFVAGVIDIINDGTGDYGNGQGIGNYDWRITGPVHEEYGPDFWEKGRLEKFKRKRGWWSCVKEVLNIAKTDYEDYPKQ